MKLYQKIRPHFLTIVVLAIVIFKGFELLPKAFFQQDEWWSFGNFISRLGPGEIRKIFWYSIIKAGKIHVNPIMEVLWFLQFKFFGLNFSSYALVSLVIHLANATLAYYLATLLTKSKYLSALAATGFAVSSISHQAVSWVSASLQTQGAILFSFLFAILFFKHLTQKKERKRLLYLSLLSIFLALLFKETALPFFLLPTLLIIYSPKKNIKYFKKVLIPVGIALLVYILLRLVIYSIADPIIVGQGIELKQPHFLVHIYRIFTLPLKALSQSIFPAKMLIWISSLIIYFVYPQFVGVDDAVNPYLAESVGLDLINYILGVFILIAIYVSYRFFRKKKENDLIYSLIISLVIIIGSVILIIFIPGRPGYVSLFEPRYFYGATFGSSLLLALCLQAFFTFLIKKEKIALFLTTVFFLPVIAINMWVLREDLIVLKNRSDLRRSLLIEVKGKYPDLPERAIFYIKSDQPYYGLSKEETNLPVQSGFGRMLMVWYQEEESFSGCFYEDPFLYDLLEQGYRYCDGRGFGFFRKENDLKIALKKNDFSVNDVFAFTWEGKLLKLTDITTEFRRSFLFSN